MIPPKNARSGQPICNRLDRFLSIGECMVEMAPADNTGGFQAGFAGDTFNTAWYMRALRPEVNTRYFTRVGTDAMSHSMLSMMDDAGIDTGSISQDQERSVGLYLISLQDGERSFSYWRDRSAARRLASDPEALALAIQDANIVYFSGITLAILDHDGRETLLSAMKSAREAGKTIAFDSNLRPRLWASDAEMVATIMQAAEVSDIILPSYDDEAAFFDDSDIDATGARYLNAGAGTIVVKNGSGPVHFWHAGEKGQVTPPVVTRIADTTSAGDSFNAGFFSGIDRSASMEDLILFASDVAGQVIGQKGALVKLDLPG